MQKNELSKKLYEGKKRIYKQFYYNSHIQIVGNDRIIIENCKKILECDEIMVKLQNSLFYITIWGENLCVSNYNKENIVINGEISSVEFEKRK